MMLRVCVSLYIRYFRIIFGRRFKKFGKNTSVIFPVGVDGIGNISLADNVYIADKTYLAALPLTGYVDSLLEIGEGSCIGRFNHIFATRRVVLGANVLTANNVYISDNLHQYFDVNTPILKQKILQNGIVEIGDGTWIGHNACILGCRIGRNCVVGSNAVVTNDVPDFCVVVGAPAYIIRRYNVEAREWENVKNGRLPRR